MAYRRDSYRKDSYTRADSYRDGRIYDDEEYGGYPGHADQVSNNRKVGQGFKFLSS